MTNAVEEALDQFEMASLELHAARIGGITPAAELERLVAAHKEAYLHAMKVGAAVEKLHEVNEQCLHLIDELQTIAAFGWSRAPLTRSTEQPSLH